MAFQVFDVAIVGGGAAGLVAAIAAADGGASVCLIEKGARLGTKLLKTGNGRCNLSNASIEGSLGAVLRSQDVAQCSGGASFYNHPAFVVPTLERFDCLSVCSFFEDLGLLTIADERGWVYPRTRSANSVLDVLVNAVGRREISVLLQHEALRIEPPADGDHFIVRVLDATDHTAADSASASPAQNAAATVIRASRVIVATGALGEQALAELTTLDTLPCVPILGPLKTEVKPIRGLNGVRVMASIRLQGSAPAEYGEILFRDYGLSGIAVFNLSRFVQQGQTLSLDFFPELSAVELLDRLKARTEKLSAPSASSFFDGMLHRRLAVILLRRCGLSVTSVLTADDLPELVSTLKDFTLRVTGAPTAQQAQVMRGGLATEGFDPQTLESLEQPGIHAAGEALAIDAPCGGYNLHWAWASALVAGKAAAGAEGARET